MRPGCSSREARGPGLVGGVGGWSRPVTEEEEVVVEVEEWEEQSKTRVLC